MIEIQHIHKKFGKLQVLNALDLSIQSGKITAIVGPNGSGKTTLIKCILGLATPDSGTITINNFNCLLNSEYRNDIGYMPQIARFPENLTALEVIEMLVDIRHSEEMYDNELIELLNLQKEMRKPLRTLSGGTRQKVSAVIAFLFQPNILIFDEPTAGLDPISSSRLKDKILKARQDGKTIIITSHIMSEIEELADEVVFLLDGKILFQESVVDILANTSESTLERAIAGRMANSMYVEHIS
ncbi:MAG: ABC transporter ATP-binding protein [Bacteroidetes bacterium]|nr:ABC transporter ATP-binding protein [Bacteroidota bacterium]